jgi:hypothetical protein
MPKPRRPRSKPDAVDRLCDAIKELTAERASRSYGPQWIMVHDVARDGSNPPHRLLSDSNASPCFLACAKRRVDVVDVLLDKKARRLTHNG